MHTRARFGVLRSSTPHYTLGLGPRFSFSIGPLGLWPRGPDTLKPIGSSIIRFYLAFGTGQISSCRTGGPEAPSAKNVSARLGLVDIAVYSVGEDPPHPLLHQSQVRSSRLQAVGMALGACPLWGQPPSAQGWA